MKPHPFFFLCLFLALCMFTSCHDASRRYLSLLATDSLMSLPADSACRILERLYPLVPDFPERQRRLFVLQQLNSFYRSDQSLSPYRAELDAACQYFLDADDETHAGLAYLLRARLEVEEAHPLAALPHFRQAIRLLEHSEKGIYLAMAYGVLGDVYMRQDLYKESMEALQKARSVYLSIHDTRGELMELNMIAYLYLFEGRCEEALRLYDERLGEMETGTDTLLWVSLLNNAGVAEQECGHYREALAKHKLAAFLSYLTRQTPNYQALGEVFYSLGENDSAFYYLDKAAISGSLETKATACSLLSALHEESGCAEEALHYASLSSQYKDSIFQQTHSLEAMRISYKHRLDEVLQLQQSKFSFKLLLVLLVSAVLLWVVILLYRHKARQAKHRLQESRMRLSKQLEYIQAVSTESNRLQEELVRLRQQQQQAADHVFLQLAAAIRSKEESIGKLEAEILDLRVRLFRNSPVGLLLQEREGHGKGNKVSVLLKKRERSEAVHEIENIFSETILLLKEQAPDLTPDDCLYCCLSLSGFSTQTIAACFGYQDGQVVRQRKYRVRQKWLQSARSSYLYKRLFGEEKNT